MEDALSEIDKGNYACLMLLLELSWIHFAMDGSFALIYSKSYKLSIVQFAFHFA